MRPRQSAKSFMAGYHGANIYVPSGHRWPPQFTPLTIPCRGFLRFRFLSIYSAKGSLVVGGSHERMPNGKERLVYECALWLSFPMKGDWHIRLPFDIGGSHVMEAHSCKRHVT